MTTTGVGAGRAGRKGGRLSMTNHPNRKSAAMLDLEATYRAVVDERDALRAQNDRLREALTNIVGQFRAPKLCGHDFTCTCLDLAVNAARAALKEAK